MKEKIKIDNFETENFVIKDRDILKEISLALSSKLKKITDKMYENTFLIFTSFIIIVWNSLLGLINGNPWFGIRLLIYEPIFNTQFTFVLYFMWFLNLMFLFKIYKLVIKTQKDVIIDTRTEDLKDYAKWLSNVTLYAFSCVSYYSLFNELL